MKYTSSVLIPCRGSSKHRDASAVRSCFRPLVFALVAVATAASLLAADDPGAPDGGSPQDKNPAAVSSSSSTTSEAPPVPRFWAGISGNYTPLKLVSVGTSTNSTTGETISSSIANGQAGVGLNLNFRVWESFWVNVGGVYRYAGFDRTDVTYDANDDIYTQRTRARNIDFPLLVRYNGSRFNVSKHTFYELGGALRFAASPQNTYTATNSTGYFSGTSADVIKFRKTTEGVIAGAGIVGRDDFGIIVAPEIRYTRWLGNEYDGTSVSSQRNQLEIAITFGY